MKNKMAASIMITVLFLAFFGIIFKIPITPVVFSDQSVSRREVWKLLNVTNPTPSDLDVDINVTVSPSRNGVHVACSTNVTEYFGNPTEYEDYTDWREWLNGTDTLAYHWGDMDWHVSDGSLTPTTYDKIQHWGNMYLDTGNVQYWTFMENTYMADCNLTRNVENPDIISIANETGNTIRIIDSPPFLRINASKTVSIAFKIVITEPGIYNFTLAATTGVTLSETNWVMGGAKTLSVPNDYPKIQDAIDAAAPDYTISVAAGTYDEDLTVTKGLTLTAESGTKIVGGIWIKDIHTFMHPIRIENFIIENGTSIDLTHDYGIKISGDIGSGADQVIVDMHILNNTLINCGKTDDVTAEMWWNAAIFFDANHFGSLGDRYDTIFTGTGEISYNTIINNLDDPAKRTQLGIGVRSGRNIKINHNNISGNVAEGIHHWSCVNTASNGNYEIDHNYINLTDWIGDPIGNNPRGIWSYAHQASISYNTIISNWIGMVLTYWDDTHWGGSTAANYSLTVNHNLIHPPVDGNMSVGLRISGNNSQIMDNEIYGATNNVTGYGVGLLFEGWGHPEWGERTECSNNTFTGNKIHDNYDGIWTWGSPYNNAFNNKFRYNNIENNTNSEMTNNNVGETVDAAYNWWGNASGPYHPDLNPTGDPAANVSDHVKFDPWLVKPYAPGQIVPVAVMYVDPDFVNLTAPALGTTFSVDVNIANVTSMYGFQLTLEWDSTLLDRTDANPKVPTPWLGVDVWVNQTLTNPNNYSLAIAPIQSGAPTFNGSTTLVSVTFKTIKDPVYPNNVTCSLALKKVKIGDASAISIPHMAYNGNYSCYSTMPKLLVTPPNSIARKVPTQFAVNVTVTNVVNLQSFEFNFTYNNTLLNVIKVENPPYIPVPYQKPSVGGIYIRVGDISPTVNGSMTLVTITFKVMRGFSWNTQATSINCTLGFDPANHTLNLGAPITHEIVNGTYSYVPLQGDVYFMDGLVDIYDLLFVASKFGTTYGPPYDDPGDLNCDGEIDILDIILVARNFGAEV